MTSIFPAITVGLSAKFGTVFATAPSYGVSPRMVFTHTTLQRKEKVEK